MVFAGFYLSWEHFNKSNASPISRPLSHYLVILNVVTALIILLPQMGWAWGWIGPLETSEKLTAWLALLLLPTALCQFAHQAFRHRQTAS